MINGNLYLLVSFVRETTFYEGLLRTTAKRGIVMDEDPDEPVSDFMKKNMQGWLGKIGKDVAQDFEMSTLSDLIDETLKKLDTPYCTNYELYHDLQSIRKAVQSGSKDQLVFRYPSNTADQLRSWKDDWQVVIEKFPSTETDIRLGTDLYCLGHSTACVFHMMRVLEDGLEALATELGVPVGADTWGQIIGNIEKAISDHSSSRRYPGKKETRKFYSEAAIQFGYFKDGWRNYVSHGKTFYSINEANKVLNHTRDFMVLLAENLNS